MAQVLRQIPIASDPNLLVGLAIADDAAVYRLDDDTALVQTVDFFPPVVDDPYDYGAIAVANAISDIYAMGGRPLIGLNIVCFPVEGLDQGILVDILKGGHDKAKEAGLLIVGGHTIDDPEPKYGLAATGLVRPGAQVTIAGAQPGDLLYLTKPLGLGIMTTGIKRGVTSPEGMREAVRIMSTLNRAAAQAMVSVGVSAATDITGYGLLGHLGEVAQGSGVQIVVRAGTVPILQEARALAGMGVVPSGTFRNMSYLEGRVDWHAEVDELTRTLLADAQTSGGLAIAVSPGRAAALEEALRREGVETVALVGECLPAGDVPLRVEP